MSDNGRQTVCSDRNRGRRNAAAVTSSRELVGGVLHRGIGPVKTREPHSVLRRLGTSAWEVLVSPFTFLREMVGPVEVAETGCRDRAERAALLVAHEEAMMLLLLLQQVGSRKVEGGTNGTMMTVHGKNTEHRKNTEPLISSTAFLTEFNATWQHRGGGDELNWWVHRQQAHSSLFL